MLFPPDWPTAKAPWKVVSTKTTAVIANERGRRRYVVSMGDAAGLCRREWRWRRFILFRPFFAQHGQDELSLNPLRSVEFKLGVDRLFYSTPRQHDGRSLRLFDGAGRRPGRYRFAARTVRQTGYLT